MRALSPLLSILLVACGASAPTTLLPDAATGDAGASLDATATDARPARDDAASTIDASMRDATSTTDAASSTDAAGTTDVAAATDAATTDATAATHDAGGPSAITGNACAVAMDCGPGFDCDTQVPGGYCLPGAPGGPDACRDPERPCPAGTICSPLPRHAISGVCLRPCAGPGDCRQGLVCAVLELFPGDPSSPHSPSPVCWSVCEVGADFTCNDDPTISSAHGSCQPDGSCRCLPGIQKNPATGRCR